MRRTIRTYVAAATVAAGMLTADVASAHAPGTPVGKPCVKSAEQPDCQWRIAPTGSISLPPFGDAPILDCRRPSDVDVYVEGGHTDHGYAVRNGRVYNLGDEYILAYYWCER